MHGNRKSLNCKDVGRGGSDGFEQTPLLTEIVPFGMLTFREIKKFSYSWQYFRASDSIQILEIPGILVYKFGWHLQIADRISNPNQDLKY